MGKREKIIDRLTNSPQNATFADIRSLLEYERFYLDLVTGSHHIFKHAEKTFVIPVHNNRVKAIYIRNPILLLSRPGSSSSDRRNSIAQIKSVGVAKQLMMPDRPLHLQLNHSI